MAFIKLMGAGILEIGWAYALEKSAGFSHLGWTVVTIVVLLVSLYLLESVIDIFGTGMTYTIFTGIGTAGTTFLGVFVFGEGASIMKFVSLAVLLFGIVGLKQTSQQKVGDGR